MDRSSRILQSDLSEAPGLELPPFKRFQLIANFAESFDRFSIDLLDRPIGRQKLEAARPIMRLANQMAKPLCFMSCNLQIGVIPIAPRRFDYYRLLHGPSSVCAPSYQQPPNSPKQRMSFV